MSNGALAVSITFFFSKWALNHRTVKYQDVFNLVIFGCSCLHEHEQTEQTFCTFSYILNTW